MNTDKSIAIEIVVHAPMEIVWNCWNTPEHIVQWAFASDDWEAPRAENDLRVGGKFLTTMAAKDKSSSFDLTGAYTVVKEHEQIDYTMEGGRKVSTVFTQTPDGVQIRETFEIEDENPREMQRTGWQSILNNFKKHAETIHSP
jgi:uncharacterized protein YndB with AHSA1/START domain